MAARGGGGVREERTVGVRAFLASAIAAALGIRTEARATSGDALGGVRTTARETTSADARGDAVAAKAVSNATRVKALGQAFGAPAATPSTANTPGVAMATSTTSGLARQVCSRPSSPTA